MVHRLTVSRARAWRSFRVCAGQVTPRSCVGVVFTGEHEVYGATNFEAIKTQTFGKVDATLGYENGRAFALGNARSKPDLIHPGQTIDYVAVTAPEEFWPITGVIRLGGLAIGPPSIWGLVALGGRTSRGGNSRGCSTSPSISRSGPGWPIWSRRSPSTATIIL